MTASHTAKRPVTLVTGFLGSGKTTLLARVLAGLPARNNTAILVNEFGKVGLDHHLLRRIDERTVLLGSGCVCCTKREDLLKALLELLALDEKGQIPRLERVIIETTGLADPAPILFTILTDPVLQHHFFVDQVIATVDAVNASLHLDRNPESIKQVVAADRIIVTKTDIAKPNQIGDLIERLRILNPSAQITEASFGEVDAAALFTAKADDRVGPPLPPSVKDLQGHHTGNDIRSASFTFAEPLDWTAFGLWLSMLLHTRGEDVLRVKGFLNTGGAGPVVLNGVQHTIHPPQHLDRWPDKDHCSQLVFIMRSIDPEDILASLRAFQRILEPNPHSPTKPG